jgi:hypothetical protein
MSNIELLDNDEKYEHELKPTESDFRRAAEIGDIEAAEHLLINNCPMYVEICEEAASYGQLKFLKWCKKNKLLNSTNIYKCIDIAEENVKLLIESNRLKEVKRFYVMIEWLKKLEK